MASALAGVGAAFLTHLIVRLAPARWRGWRQAVDGVAGLLVGAGLLLAEEQIAHLAFRFYVLLALGSGAALYAILAAPAIGAAMGALRRRPGARRR